jgi:DNA polymerase elongation subunit (family B)
MARNNYLNAFVYGNKVLERGYDHDGKRFMRKVDFNPTLYLDVPSKGQTDEGWRTLYNRKVYPIQPGSIKDCRAMIDQYSDVEGFNIYGMTDYTIQYLSETYPGERSPDMDIIRLYAMDIETAAENEFPNPLTATEEILLISFYDSYHKGFHVFSARDFNLADVKVPEECKFPLTRVFKHVFPSEDAMLRGFLHYWEGNPPDVITGWYSDTFDIPYICRRIERLYGDEGLKQLSPWNLAPRPKSVTVRGKETVFWNIPGISCIDYIDIYQKSTAIPKRESYGLDFIGEVELDQKKLDYSEFESFKAFYKGDWNKFVAYNVIDVHLVNRLEDKLKLLELTFTVAYDAKVNFEDVQGQIRVWDSLIYNELKNRKIIIPNKDYRGKSEQFEGAHVKDTVPGKYKWIITFDLDSLYPHIMMWANISPETLRSDLTKLVEVEGLLAQKYDLSELREKNYAMTANGVCYTKDTQGFLAGMMERMYADRKRFKKEMLKAEDAFEQTKDPKYEKEIARLNNLQLARKIQLNSAYGAIGSPYFRYYDLRIAEGITLSGQLAIRWMADRINVYLNDLLKTNNFDYIIAIDTDAFYINLEKLVEKVCAGKTDEAKINFMDKVGKEVFEPLIAKGYQELADYMNAYKQAMSMKREALCDVGLFVAKKNYALNVWDSEGVRYKEPKLKVKGLALVKSDTPKVCREKLKELVKIALFKTEADVQKYIMDFRKEYNKLDPHEIAKPSGVNGLKEWSGSPIYKKGCPIHVRASLLHNHHVRRLKLDDKFEMIQGGDKMKWVYLKMPNPLHENVLGWTVKYPEEVMPSKFVDYEEMFETTFLSKAQILLNPLGWQAEAVADLSDFFG